MEVAKKSNLFPDSVGELRRQDFAWKAWIQSEFALKQSFHKRGAGNDLGPVPERGPSRSGSNRLHLQPPFAFEVALKLVPSAASPGTLF